jgi:hypothetical protein
MCFCELSFWFGVEFVLNKHDKKRREWLAVEEKNEPIKDELLGGSTRVVVKQ